MLKIVFYVTLLSLTLGQFSLLTRGIGFNLYLFDVLVSFFAFYGVSHFLLKKDLYFPKQFLGFFMFSLFAAFTLVPNYLTLGAQELLVSGFYLYRFLVYVLAGLVVFNMLRKGIIDKSLLAGAFIISGVLLVFAGYIQLVYLPDFSVLDPSLGWDPHKNRMASTFFDPNFVGGYLVLCSSLLFDALFSKTLTRQKFFVYSVAQLIILSGVFLTFSRSSWGMLGVIFIVYGFLRYRFLLVLALMTGLLAYYAVPRVQTRLSGITDPADSAHFRLISWSNTLNIANDNLLYGVGFNSFKYAQEDYGYLVPGETGNNAAAGSDSSLLLVMATTGVIGLMFYLVSYFQVLFALFTTKSNLKILGFSLVGGLVLHSQFVNSLFYPQILFILMCLFGWFSYSVLNK